MRIIGGTAAGLILKAPKGFDVRPTPDLVRQAIFNSLGPRVDAARVLDLFSGTGALGLECLSRGAIEILSIEKTHRHAEIIRQNLASTRLPADAVEIREQDVFTAIHQLAAAPRQFTLIMADPPFGKKNIGVRSTSASQQLLDDKHLPQLLHPDGLFVLGHTKRDTLEIPPHWQEKKQMKHGDHIVRFLRKPA
jgi:16S rRNA (guanine966-N2)-methyltransferase